MQKPRRSVSFALSAVLLACPLAACAGNPVKDAAQAVGIGGEPKAAPDFITRTRQQNYDYMPVGETAAKRAKPKNAATVAGDQASMDALRTKNEALGREAQQAGQAAQAAAPAPAKLPE